MKCLVYKRKRLKREFGFSGYCEFFSYNSLNRTCVINTCKKNTAEHYSVRTNNENFVTYFRVNNRENLESFSFLGKPDDEDFRRMDFV